MGCTISKIRKYKRGRHSTSSDASTASSRSMEMELEPTLARQGITTTTTTTTTASATTTIGRFMLKRSKRHNNLRYRCLNYTIPKKILCCFKKDDISMTKIERTIKATLLIQKWFRRYMARLEVRRRYTWTIFQSIEYAGEQDQVRLYNFFNALLTHIPDITVARGESSMNSRNSSIEDLEMKFEDESDDEDLMLSGTERVHEFKLQFPLNEEQLQRLIDCYRRRRPYRLHARYVADILKESIIKLKRLPNLNLASTAISKQITICGDLHGKLDDLLVIFHKNGLPSPENPYVFNGDFVDRGKQGIEVLLVLLASMLVYPGGVYLNRGNHEDHIMNSRYGFIRWLPLGTIVNNKVLIVHGGISDTTDLDLIRSLDRGKYVSLLRPPLNDSSAPGAELIDKVEWKQVFDILWSDPQTGAGCVPNSLRGAGTYFGPDVTKNFLERNRMFYLVRSHECKPEGYEIIHDNSVVTIFSASNYYEVGSNKGAYVKLVGPQLDTHFVQYMAAAGKAKKLTFRQRIGLVEASAMKELFGQITTNRRRLEMEFAKYDPEGIGLITVSEWCTSMEAAIGLGLPWRMLKEKLVNVDPATQKVNYITTFQNIGDGITNSVQGASTVVETLYRNKSSLEAIFRIIDKDNSGYISLEEFSDACNLINEHMASPITQEQLIDMCHMMDINKDGYVDLNEFLEAFRLVDPESRKNRNLSLSATPTHQEHPNHNNHNNHNNNDNNDNGTVQDTNSIAAPPPPPPPLSPSQIKITTIDDNPQTKQAESSHNDGNCDDIIIKQNHEQNDILTKSPVLSDRNGN